MVTGHTGEEQEKDLRHTFLVLHGFLSQGDLDSSLFKWLGLSAGSSQVGGCLLTRQISFWSKTFLLIRDKTLIFCPFILVPRTIWSAGQHQRSLCFQPFWLLVWLWPFNVNWKTKSHNSFYGHMAPFQGLYFVSDPIGHARTWAWKWGRVVGEGPGEDQRSPVGNCLTGIKCRFQP